MKHTKKPAKCLDCGKRLAFEQNYIENPYVKPLERTHTIIMSHNLNVLEYIYNKFVCKNYASVGYYVGGMSEPELKRSEKQQVILSSYQMASEGLDIPSLNAEFLISPKTDIIQIVGRILRAKHAYSHPIIYDFVDTHEPFQKQWLKRKAYYKKQQYKIIGADTYTYPVAKWKNIYVPPTVDEEGVTSKCTDVSNENDSEEEEEEETQKAVPGTFGKCLLKIKK